MSNTLPSCRPCECCGATCPLGTPEEPCWGDVTVWNDDTSEGLLHACEGHSWCYWIAYRPSTQPEDCPQGVNPA